MKIGNIQTKNNFFLAPLAGVTDLPFRTLCTEYGAGYTCTEMVSAKALCFCDRKTAELLGNEKEQGTKAVQLFGSEPDIIARAVKMVQPFADIIDINMGCPAPKIVKNGEGSALMKNPALAGEIIAAAVESTKKPVTVKIRKGFDEEHVNAVELAQIAEKMGVSAIAVHGRTTSQHYSGKADLDIIKSVKEAVKVPVIGNGDIFSGADAKNMLEKTGCDAIMVGRGCLGNPFIFREIAAFIQSGEVLLPTPDERIQTAARHIKMLVATKGEHIGILEARKHAAWYLKGIRGVGEARKAVYGATTLDQMIQILQKLREV
ncbi:MAG: tRNA dihydrouridine synthase DusB [Clostridia bacterium]|nr:tRNA dihydrouridine synthase DusB [Clostridia bacterium]